jgi:hypothetical protein
MIEVQNCSLAVENHPAIAAAGQGFGIKGKVVHKITDIHKIKDMRTKNKGYR